MDDCIVIENYEIVEDNDYKANIYDCFQDAKKAVIPFLDGAKVTFSEIEKMLYSAPAFVETVKSCIPKEMFDVVLSSEQKNKLDKGVIELVTQKNGTIKAILRNAKTKKFVANVDLKKVQVSPDISKAVADYATQMQMAQIAEQIQLVQVAVKNVIQGQENDRLAMAYSCEQKLLQARNIKNAGLKTTALLNLASDAEDCRNLLMLSQKLNINYIKEQPEEDWKKWLKGTNNKTIDSKMSEIRVSLYAINKVSLTQAIAYEELGETEAAKCSLEYYADFIDNTYLSTSGLVERLDMLDANPENYWTKTIPTIKENIYALPSYTEQTLLED